MNTEATSFTTKQAGSRTPQHILAETARYGVLIIVSIFTAFPFFWMVVSALKTKTEIMDITHFLPATPQWSNFTSVLFDSPILHYVWNSMVISLIVIFLSLFSFNNVKYALCIACFVFEILLSIRSHTPLCIVLWIIPYLAFFWSLLIRLILV